MAATTPVIALCADNQVNLDKDFFSSFGARVASFATPEELLAFLKTTRPHGVCLVFGVQTLVSRPPWLLELERRAFFEGLRVVVFMRSHGGGLSVNELLSSSSDESLRSRFSPVLAFRDVIIYDFPLTTRERRSLRSRVALSLGLTTGPVHDEKVALLVRRAGRVRVSLPGRASWIGNDKTLCIECSVRPKLNSFCTLRFVEGRRSVVELHAICKDVSTTNLRFNYGSKIRVGLSDGEFVRFVEYFRREDERNLSKGRSIRRAVLVIRSPAVRERVSQVLRARNVEMRLPLVWRNVKADVPRMNPHFVFVEDAVLLKNPERTQALLAELKAVVPKDTELCIVGPGAEALAADDESLRPFSDLMRLEEALSTHLEKTRNRVGAEDEQRLWISAESSVADCIVEVEDEYVFTGSSGIVIEGPNSYRSLCNAVLDFANGEPRLLAKNTGSYLSTDLWKLPPAASPQDAGNLSQFHFTFLQASEDYAREFNFALRLETESFRQRHPLPPEVLVGGGEEPAGEPSGELGLPEAEEPPSAPVPVARPRRKSSSFSKEALVVVGALLIIVALLALVATREPQSDAPFTKSFQKLYESKGRNGGP